MAKKIFIWIVVLGAIAASVALYKYFTRPLPGQPVAYMGNRHVPENTPVEYNSNPPTSGPHFEIPIPAGIYSIPQPDIRLVHSLEHGYVIVSYSCDSTDPGCLELVNQLSRIPASVDPQKLIIVPRPNLDTRIALTAWTRIDKLDSYDDSRIKNFISAWRGRGPETTTD